MRTNSQRGKIREVLAICKDRWRSNGMLEDEVEMMGEEVEGDLQDAVENGKTVEEVVGPDVQEFASLYAEDTELDSPRDRFMVGIIVVALVLIVALGIGLRLTSYLGFSPPWYVVVALSTIAAVILVFWTGKSR